MQKKNTSKLAEKLLIFRKNCQNVAEKLLSKTSQNVQKLLTLLNYNFLYKIRISGFIGSLV